MKTNLSSALFSRGPFPIPAKRKISNEFHRIFSIKAGMRTVCVESPLEADAIYWAESNPEIMELCEQPLRIQHPIGNKPFFTFDLSVRWTSGAEYFYEIKPESSMEMSSSGRLIPKNWDSIQEICIANSYNCQVLSDRDLNKKFLEITNWRRLLPFARTAYEREDPRFDCVLIDIVKKIENITIFQVLSQLPEFLPEETIGHVAKLIHQGRLSANLNNARLTGLTTISLPDEGKGNSYFDFDIQRGEIQ